MLRNIKLILEYDGTNYHGWQSQQGSGVPTIQDALEEALRKLTKENIRTVSSGRTDAGVHAVGHVANFPTESRIPAEAWAPALNSLLPADIRVIASEEAPPDFHARFSAKGKQYQYLVLARRSPSALRRNHVWHVDRKLNLAAMRLWDGIYWLPRRQEIEIRRRTTWLDVPARGIIRGRWEIAGYAFNQDPPDRLFLGPEIVAVPGARDSFPWPEPLDAAVGRELGPRPTLRMDEVRSAAQTLVGARSLSGLRAHGLSVRSASSCG